MLEELKPCPFCGGEAAFKTVFGKTYVGCTNYDCRIGIWSLSDHLEEAVEKWNRREKNGRTEKEL